MSVILPRSADRRWHSCVQHPTAAAPGNSLRRSSITAEAIADALDGRPVGDGWAACCPAHDDNDPSLSIHAGHNGKVLVHCHAGCTQAEVIAALRDAGLWGTAGTRSGRLTRGEPHDDTSRRTDREKRNSEAALSIWYDAVPAPGTLVETYLRSRGLCLSVPPALRFHPALTHASGGVWPAMVALVIRGVDGKSMAIHRTYLAHDGRGKAAVNPSKMMLGPCRGGVVPLALIHNSVLMVGEGIETCLAAMQATDLPACAALSASGLRSLALPAKVREVIVLADGDDPGEQAAREAARRWIREGRRVRIARPPRGLDFNDLLLGRAPGSEESAS